MPAVAGEANRCPEFGSSHMYHIPGSVPVRSVHLTSGRGRTMTLGSQVVELRHAPRWQFAVGNRPSGEVLRAPAWLGPEQAAGALRTLNRTLPASELQAIAAARAMLPSWLAEHVSKVVVNG